MRFEIVTLNVDKAERLIEGYGERATDIRPAGDAIVRRLVVGEKRRFKTSAGWAPLKPSTKARKKRQKLPRKAMKASGLLEKTLTRVGATARSHGQLSTVSRSEVRFGIKGGRSDIFYGAISQKGREGQKARKVVVFTARTKKAVRFVIEDHLAGRDVV